MKKYILVVVILIITGVIVTIAFDTFWGTRFWSGEDTWICQNGEWVKHGNPSAPMPTEPCGKIETKNEISNLLETLKQTTGINFSEIRDIEFKWAVKIDPNIEEVNVQGKGFEVEHIPSKQYRNIESFFKNNDFCIIPSR